MAIGFTPKHTEDVQLENLTKQQFLALVVEAMVKLEWELNYIGVNGVIAYTKRKLDSPVGEFKVKIGTDAATISSSSIGSEFIDWGKNKIYVKTLLNTVYDLRQDYTNEELEKKYDELKKVMEAEEDVDDSLLAPTSTKEEIAELLELFKVSSGYVVTPVLFWLNILIFVFMAISGVSILEPDSQTLVTWGANFRPYTLDGEWWRLLSSCFVHIGIFHLLLNMYALIYVGKLLEPLLGWVTFLTSYVLTGIVASVTSMWVHNFTVSAGASGAIFGLYGVFLALLTTNVIEKESRTKLLSSIGIFVVYNLFYGLKEGVDNAAHIGGLLFGILVGYAIIPGLKTPASNRLRITTITVIIIVAVGIAAVVYNVLPNDISVYNKKMEEFRRRETKAIEVYTLLENAPTDKILRALREDGLNNWKENVIIINSLEEMDLPTTLKKRNQLLKEYCNLRMRNCELLYKTISENTNNYSDQLEEVNSQLRSKLSEIEKASEE